MDASAARKASPGTCDFAIRSCHATSKPSLEFPALGQRPTAIVEAPAAAAAQANASSIIAPLAAKGAPSAITIVRA
jgi:hypothetical protein